jgi:polyisoprenoid-binding protein YceI
MQAKGEMTIRDVTRPIELAVEFGGVITDPWIQSRIFYLRKN